MPMRCCAQSGVRVASARKPVQKLMARICFWALFMPSLVVMR